MKKLIALFGLFIPLISFGAVTTTPTIQSLGDVQITNGAPVGSILRSTGTNWWPWRPNIENVKDITVSNDFQIVTVDYKYQVNRIIVADTATNFVIDPSSYTTTLGSGVDLSGFHKTRLIIYASASDCNALWTNVTSDDVFINSTNAIWPYTFARTNYGIVDLQVKNSDTYNWYITDWASYGFGVGITNHVVTNLYNNLVSYYKMDEETNTTRIDNEGSKNLTAAYTNIPYAAGVIVNCASNYMVDESSGLSAATFNLPSVATSWTIHLWFLMDYATNNVEIIDDGFGNSTGYILKTEDVIGTNLVLNVEMSGTNATITSTPTWTVGIWNRIAFGWTSGTGIWLKINDETTETLATTGTPAAWTGNFSLFSGSGQGTMFGKIDEVGIWSRKLRDDELTRLWNSGNALGRSSF